MGVHLLHVSKAGGTSLRTAILEAQELAGGELLSPWGPVWTHRGHSFALRDVPRDDKAIFALRDPITRFVSGFFSRQRKGAPRYFREWSEEERQAFEWFSSPEELADALADSDRTTRERAEFAMESIRQLKRPLTKWTGSPRYLRKHLDQVLYIARQETLDEDWERLKELLELPRSVMLPQDDTAAHRTPYPREIAISEGGRQALRKWYAPDFEVLEIAEAVRRSAAGARSG
jgi:Sulfotransferase family